MFDSKKYTTVRHDQRGSLLLMAMLILSGIVTAASTIGVITMQNLRQAILVDDGIVSFYAGESGIEDGLYEIRKKETAVSSLPASGSLSNTAQWSRSITTTVESVTQDIAQNDFWEIDLYDPDTSLSALGTAIRSLRLSWTGGAGEWIEVQAFPWGTSGTLGTPTTQLFSAGTNPAVVNLQDSTATLYRIRIKALYAPVTDMTVRAYSGLNAGGAQVYIPANVTMISTGSFKRTKQALRATMIQRPPLSGVFGYVLFAEDSLIKG